jgi:hypothetical protein
MAKKKVIQNTAAEQQEILSKPIHPLGSGEHQALQDMTKREFLSATDLQAAQIAKAVMEQVRGQLTQEDEDRFRRYQEFADKRDAEARKFEEDKMKWWDTQLAKIESLKKTGFDKDRIVAKAADMDRQAREESRAESADALIKFKQRCASAPKISIISPGLPVRTKEGVRYFPEVIKMIVGSSPQTFVLPINQVTELPDFIAKEYIARKDQKRVLDKLPEQLAKMEDFSKVTAIAPEVNPDRAINTTSYVQSLPVPEGNE